jgi:hypothetical protein
MVTLDHDRKPASKLWPLCLVLALPPCWVPSEGVVVVEQPGGGGSLACAALALPAAGRAPHAPGPQGRSAAGHLQGRSDDLKPSHDALKPSHDDLRPVHDVLTLAVPRMLLAHKADLPQGTYKVRRRSGHSRTSSHDALALCASPSFATTDRDRLVVALHLTNGSFR